MGPNKIPQINSSFNKSSDPKTNNNKLEKEVKSVRALIEKMDASMNKSLLKIIELLTASLEAQDRKIEEVIDNKKNKEYVAPIKDYPALSTSNNVVNKKKNTKFIGTGEGLNLGVVFNTERSKSYTLTTEQDKVVKENIEEKKSSKR